MFVCLQVLGHVAPSSPGPVGAPLPAAGGRTLHGCCPAQRLQHQGGGACGGPQHGGAGGPAPEGPDGHQDGDQDGHQDGDDGGTRRERETEQVTEWTRSVLIIIMIIMIIIIIMIIMIIIMIMIITLQPYVLIGSAVDRQVMSPWLLFESPG